MIIKLTKNGDEFARVIFSWSLDLENCDHVAVGTTDEELDAMLAGSAHQGVDFPGWTSEIS